MIHTVSGPEALQRRRIHVLDLRRHDVAARRELRDSRGVREGAHELRRARLRGGAARRRVEHDDADAEAHRRARQHHAQLAAAEDAEGARAGQENGRRGRHDDGA